MLRVVGDLEGVLVDYARDMYYIMLPMARLPRFLRAIYHGSDGTLALRPYATLVRAYPPFLTAGLLLLSPAIVQVRSASSHEMYLTRSHLC